MKFYEIEFANRRRKYGYDPLMNMRRQYIQKNNSLGGSRVGMAIIPEAFAATKYARVDILQQLVRKAMIAGGLGRSDPDRPLADIIQPGMSVLLKPNWVLHENCSGCTMDCMVTHPAFILAVLREVVLAGAGRIIIADAPIQRAKFDLIAPVMWKEMAQAIGGAVPIEIIDLRNAIAVVKDRRVEVVGERRSAERFILFKMGSESFLDPISVRKGIFRNTSYDPREMARVHIRGDHRFLLCREPFEADILINMPKLKAHAKAGVTAALKNAVGLNGDKNFLPHHRVGGSKLGGDCYKGIKPFKRVAEFFLDMANQRIGRNTRILWEKAAAAINRVHGGDLEGKWYGNDTTWRMVLDLNRLLIYGRLDGSIASTPQRRIFSLTDGIVAGQHNGPLYPQEINLGAVTFAENSAYADLVHTALMRFDWRRIPLVREAFSQIVYPLTELSPDAVSVHCDGKILSLDEVSRYYGRSFRSPDGWVGHVELG